jgi:LacI family transcriptional regulator
MTNISEVARVAVVSTSTVSHVLNETRYVSPEKGKLVTDAVAAVGYIPNVLARSVKMSSIILGQPALTNTIERTKSCRPVMAENGCEVLGTFISDGNRSPADAAAATHRLLALCEPPTVIVDGNNLTMIGITRAVRERGLRVPSDVSLLGIDDFEWADCFEPHLTLIAVPREEIGRKAAELLIKRISNRRRARQSVRLSPVLRVRESYGEAS